SRAGGTPLPRRYRSTLSGLPPFLIATKKHKNRKKKTVGRLISRIVTVRAPCDCLGPRRLRARPHLSRAASGRDHDTTPPASFDTPRSSDRVLWQHLILPRRHVSLLRLMRVADHTTRDSVARWEQLARPTQTGRARPCFVSTRLPQVLLYTVRRRVRPLTR